MYDKILMRTLRSDCYNKIEYECNLLNLHVALGMLLIIKFHTSLGWILQSTGWQQGGSESLENIIIGLEFRVLLVLNLVLLVLHAA